MPLTLHDEHERRGALQLSGVRRDGSTFPVEVSVNHVATPGGGRTFAFVTDITDRERAASALWQRTAELESRTTQLSRMASDLTLAEQRAREAIARTLHDGLQQLLVIAALNLEQELKRESDRGAVPSERIREAKFQLDEAIAAARSLNFELFPPVLQRSGLPGSTEVAGKLDARQVQDRGPRHRRSAGRLRQEGRRTCSSSRSESCSSTRSSTPVRIESPCGWCSTPKTSCASRCRIRESGSNRLSSTIDRRPGRLAGGCSAFGSGSRCLAAASRLTAPRARGTRVRLVAPRGDAHTAAGIAENHRPLLRSDRLRPATMDRASPDALRILIVDDHAGVRSALRDILHQRPQLSVVGDAANGFEAIAHAHVLQPDVILMDVAMPYMDGIEATTRIRAELPDIQILGLSMQPRSAAADAIEQAGAAAFFVKGTDTQRLIEHLLGMQALRPSRFANS
jgi:CheY-like chemotaxis protein